ncbi:glycosyltransferase family 61 protein [Cyanobium sp. FGCU-52]|nr:glycosyltransferase family 61 protein [Cyanobium sp. FGCU52]
MCSLVDSRQWCGSYFHWFLDCLPRLIAAHHHSLRRGEAPRVIVPASLNPWQGESLHLIGLPAEQRIAHHPIGGGGIAVERLIGYVAHRWQRLGDAPFDAASPWAIRWLADHLSAAVPRDSGLLPRRLYLSRGGAPTRRVANEDEVLALLEPHGFVAVRCEQLSLSEQIALFRDATHIVAPHGAGLTNLLHARGGCVLELFPEGHGVRPDFFQLAMINHLSYQHAVCPSSGPAINFKVPARVIENFLDRML